MSQSKTPQTVTVALPDNITIAQAEALHEHLETFLQSNDDILIDGQAVARADTAGLQTLLAFCNALHARDVKVSWKAPSESLRLAAKQLGLSDILSLNN